ncbi:MAG: hypothetical protein NTY19_26755 [Planctomycetota bacterium]|nr:hypothetical protein [Planctomycetota bacterium]
MTEKLEWAARCVERMNVARSDKNATDVQDHFWSFLHASRLVWFYLGEFHKARGDANGAAKITMNTWTATNLSPIEQRVWDTIANLRTEDVHTRPVETEERTSGASATRGGKLLTRNGKLCIVKKVEYKVLSGTDEFDAIDLANRGLGLLQRFVADFPCLV